MTRQHTLSNHAKIERHFTVQFENHSLKALRLRHCVKNLTLVELYTLILRTARTFTVFTLAPNFR